MTMYKITEQDVEYLNKTFVYHPPKEGQPETYTIIRDAFRNMALMLLEYTPPSRERSVALTHLETSVFWANAAIARNGK